MYRPSNLEVFFFSRFTIEVAASENWDVVGFVWDGASAVVSFEALTSVRVLSSFDVWEFSLEL